MNLSANPYGPYIVDDGPDSIPEEEVAIFVPQFNTTKPDATGAFHPEAKNFCDHWGWSHNRICYINNKLAKSCHKPNNVADHFLDEMEKFQNSSSKPIAVWTYFFHGYTHGIQFSIRSPGHPHFDSEYEARYERFLDIISDHPSPMVILYACSTGDDPDGDPDTAPGSGDNSFGDYTRDNLCKRGAIYCRVLVHTTAGHTTINPFVKILDGEGRADGGEGGKLIAAPGTKEFKRFRKLLKTDFRFVMPFMTKKSIQKKITV